MQFAWRLLEAFYHAFVLLAIAAGIAAGIYLYQDRKRRRKG